MTITLANELVLTTGSQAIFSPVLHQGSVPERVDPCPTLLQTEQQQLSAAEHEQASLCPNASARTPALPSTGAKGSDARTPSLGNPSFVLFIGLALLTAGVTRAAWRKDKR